MNYVKSELEQLPYFNQQTASFVLKKQGLNLYRQIERLVKKGVFLRLKSGLYVTKTYWDRNSTNPQYLPQIANNLLFPSYLSLDYALSLYGLIPETINLCTSVTLKSSRSYRNFLGTFSYTNIKPVLFTGFANGMASKAKALFDYLYLKQNLSSNFKQELTEGLRINWANFLQKDLREFKTYCRLVKSAKMDKICKELEAIV
jgi:predicted transcriptional regulator of viral defense system